MVYEIINKLKESILVDGGELQYHLDPISIDYMPLINGGTDYIKIKLPIELAEENNNSSNNTNNIKPFKSYLHNILDTIVL
jgi:hypothetical protein